MRDAFHEPARHLAESARTFTRFGDHRRRDTRDPGTGCRHYFLGGRLALGCGLPLRRFARGLGAFRRHALCRAPVLRCALRRRALPRLFLSRSAARLGPLGRRTGRLALCCHGCSSREVRESRSPQKIRAKRPQGKSRRMRQLAHRTARKRSIYSAVERRSSFCPLPEPSFNRSGLPQMRLDGPAYRAHPQPRWPRRNLYRRPP